ncbi:MAG TPA: Rieske 2Fe-2S domain-containing protein, partial [Pyrinomonadaceae bacterium]|nr:Rieske 2Fe-2S domain-containing protein [Pyrinomonadaceae bacterium]
EGLAEVLKGAQVVVDVSNSPSFEDTAVMDFFQTSTRNLLSYEAAAGVGHHVALSVVGSERLPQSGYMRAKVAQEKLIKEGTIPYTIFHATQFFEFTKRIADEATLDNKVYLPPILFQPMAADDVASALCKAATSSPLNGTIEIAGPEAFRFDDLIRQRLTALKDPREVVADPNARYFGAEMSERSIVPEDTAQLGETRFDDWLSLSTTQAPATTAQPATAASINPVVLKENEFRVSEVPPGSALLVGEAAVFNVGGNLCATHDKCTHKQGPLSKGKLDGSTVTCPWHGSQFNVCTGEVLRGPATDPVKTYQVNVDGDTGRVETDAATAAKA